jgi:hypothetical protein
MCKTLYSSIVLDISRLPWAPRRVLQNRRVQVRFLSTLPRSTRQFMRAEDYDIYARMILLGRFDDIVDDSQRPFRTVDEEGRMVLDCC